MDLSNLKRLFTKDDFLQIHKILGILCLSHFVYRIANGFHEITQWHMNFWLICHASLSASSLIFHLPQNRIKAAPMIWPEFRIHSILFAFRSIFCCLAVVNMSNHLTLLLIKHALLIITIVAADITSDVYKKNDNKLGTTMRGMPMPTWFRPTVKYCLNYYYSVSQVLATLTLIIERSGDPVGPIFWPVFPIQLAPLLMTLTRKGLLSSFGWHIGYAAALLWNYIYGLQQDCNFPMRYWNYTIFFCVARFHLKVNKYIVWVVICATNLFISLA
jgi:hypothetical protein